MSVISEDYGLMLKGRSTRITRRIEEIGLHPNNRVQHSPKTRLFACFAAAILCSRFSWQRPSRYQR